MQHIIIMPPHIIIIGMAFIIAIIFVQHSMNISLDMPSMGIMVQVMPSGVIVHVIRAIIIGIGIMVIMPGIIPGMLIGIAPGIPMGIMPPIIGIGAGMPIGIIGIAAFISALLVEATPWSLSSGICVRPAAPTIADHRLSLLSSKHLDAPPPEAEKQLRWRYVRPT